MIEFKGHIARAEDRTEHFESQSAHDSHGETRYKEIKQAEFAILTNGPYPLDFRDLVGKNVRVIIED